MRLGAEKEEKPDEREKGNTMDSALISQYAELVVRVGANVQKGQTVLITCPVDCAAFLRLLVEQSYRAGAGDVIVSWNDDFCVRQKYLYAKDGVFDAVYPWDKLMRNGLAEQDLAAICVSAEDPENLRGVSPDRLRRAGIASSRDLAPYYAKMMSNGFAWCVVCVPTAAWAKTVFPDAPQAQAMDKLWAAILSAVRVTPGGDAAKEWLAHCEALDAVADKLNALHLESLHYSNALGTDLTVRMPEDHLWLSGADTAKSGVRFVANMPTEEVFSAPLRTGVNGTICASMPLVLNGSLVTGIRMTLRDGRIEQAHADQGEDVLLAELDVHEDARYLGEIALVPCDSPIAQGGLLFYNTLFDENASCHFAFGEAYSACIRGGDDMTPEELVAHGINASRSTHVDFMVGTPDLSITGTTRDGRHVQIFKDGRFSI